MMSNYSDYFKLRNVESDFYLTYKIPNYLIKALPSDKGANILDIGCGFGSLLRELKKIGYNSTKGIDISQQAIEYCSNQNFDVQKASIIEFADLSPIKFEFICISHVLEHIKKEDIIETLILIRNKLLTENGRLCLMVPNAQSNTGAYWAYEDFTHHTLFTSGSLLYVLNAAGFTKITFLDPDGTCESKNVLKNIKKFLLSVYKLNYKFWNKVTSSSFHRQSPLIFTYELKVLAEK